MPCPDFDVSIVKRSDGRSAVAAAAYQSGSRLYSEYDQKWKNYTGKHEVIHEEIMLPSNAPSEYADRQTLWNAVEEIEKSWNSQLARKFRMALPREVPQEQYAEMVQRYCQEQFVSKGMICDFAIHDKGDGNPHVHIQLTMRSMDENGKWNPKSHKVYVLDENGERIRLPTGNWKSVKQDVVDWNDQKYCEIWRTAWADMQNAYLAKNGRSERADLRSYERQGLDQVPMVHMGPAVAALEEKGVKTNIGNLNRDIQQHNHLMEQIRKAIRSLTRWIAELSEKRKVILELLKEEREPTLIDLLADYMEVRQEERSTWSSLSQLKGTASDYNKIRAVMDYLKENNIRTVDDLKAKIDEVTAIVSPLRSKIRSNEKRIRRIDMTLSRYETFCRLKPVHDEYLKKGFKWTREKYQEAHKEELDQYNAAYRYLLKNGARKNGSRLQFSPEELKAERAQLLRENENAQADIDAVSGEMETLNKVRYYVSKVQPEPEQVAEIVQQKEEEPEKQKSIREALKENQRKVAERESAKRKKKQNMEL